MDCSDTPSNIIRGRTHAVQLPQEIKCIQQDVDDPFSSRSASPTHSAQSSSTVSGGVAERKAQRNILDIIKQICSSNNRPFDKLQQLQQARVIKLVSVVDLSQSGQNTVCVKVNVRDDRTLGFTACCPSKKAAEKEASEEVLDVLYEDLMVSPPHQLFDIVAPVGKQAGPTASEPSVMAEDQRHLEILKSMRGGSAARVISIDLEQYELDHTIPLEVGMSHVILEQQCICERVQSFHWIVEDYEHLANGRYCPNNRDNFIFGTSETLQKTDLKASLESLLEELGQGYQKVYRIGHTIQSDLKWLNAMGISLPESFVICDIGRAYRAMASPDDYVNMTGMERLMDALNIDHLHMHNAGNDARYNLEVLESLLRMLSEKGITLLPTRHE